MSFGADPRVPLVLDTSAFSHLQRGDDRVLDHVSSAVLIVLPTIVVGELRAGYELGSHLQANRKVLDAFLAEPFVRLQAVDLAAAHGFGRISAQLRRRGRPIPTNDIWIAAVTMSCGGHLLTFDKDFHAIDDLPATVLTP